jgi:heme/copper-type cytochrome/quinol oxidase subunit 2
VLRIAGVLSGVVVLAWAVLIASVDLKSDAQASIAYIWFTLYAIVALILIWLTVLIARRVRRRPDIAKPS